jgi:hypothetical protein
VATTACGSTAEAWPAIAAIPAASSGAAERRVARVIKVRILVSRLKIAPVPVGDPHLPGSDHASFRVEQFQKGCSSVG